MGRWIWFKTQYHQWHNGITKTQRAVYVGLTEEKNFWQADKSFGNTNFLRTHTRMLLNDKSVVNDQVCSWHSCIVIPTKLTEKLTDS